MLKSEGEGGGMTQRTVRLKDLVREMLPPPSYSDSIMEEVKKEWRVNIVRSASQKYLNRRKKVKSSMSSSTSHLPIPIIPTLVKSTSVLNTARPVLTKSILRSDYQGSQT